jgi:divalent metal cation (Fe/Co/Zn/Cd) transporter
LTARRERDLRRALLLSGFSVAWSGITGAIAVWLSRETGSITVLGFGIEAVIDAAASVALIWRFRVERSDPGRAAKVERRAERALGIVLLAAAIVVAAGSVRSLLSETHVEQSGVALLLLVASALVLPPLALGKGRAGEALASNALRADAFLTWAAAVLACVSLAGLVAAASLGIWWADPLGALLIAVVLAREGWSVWNAGTGR